MHGPLDLSRDVPASSAQSRARLRHRGAHEGGHRPARRRSPRPWRAGDEHRDALRTFHQAAWNEPLLLRAVGAGRARLRRAAPPSRRSPRRSATALAAVPAGAAPVAAAGAARALASRGAAALPAALAGDARPGHRHPPRPRHLHDEVQPEGERGARPLAQGRRTCIRGRTTPRRRGSSRRCGGFERIICEISGMDRASFQPGGGTQAVYANARMIARRAGGARRGRRATR